MAKVKNAIRSIKVDSPELGLSLRVANILESNEIFNVGALIGKHHWELMLLRGFGEMARHEVRKALAKLGLRLKDDPKSYQTANPCPLCGHERKTQ